MFCTKPSILLCAGPLGCPQYNMHAFTLQLYYMHMYYNMYYVLCTICTYVLQLYNMHATALRRIVRTFISIFPSLHMRYFTGRKPQDFCHYPVDFHSKLHRLSTTEKKHNQKCIEKVKKSHLRRRFRNPRDQKKSLDIMKEIECHRVVSPLRASSGAELRDFCD